MSKSPRKAVESRLHSLGYSIRDRLISSQAEDPQFLLLLSSQGYPILAEIQDKTASSIDKISHSPLTHPKHKFQIYDNLTLGTCGVAFDNGYTILWRNPQTLACQELHYQKGPVQESDIPIFIYRLSDILNSPESVETLQTENLQKIKNHQIHLGDKDLTFALRTVDQFNQSLNNFTRQRQLNLQKLQNSITMCRNILSSYTPQTIATNQESYNLLLYNLYLRNQKIYDILAIQQDVIQEVEKLQPLLTIINQKITELDEKFSGLGETCRL